MLYNSNYFHLYVNLFKTGQIKNPALLYASLETVEHFSKGPFITNSIDVSS